MSLEIKLSEEAEKFLSIHTIVNDKYFFVPFWYEKLENGNFKAHSFEKLPEDLKQTIKDMRKIEKDV